ncbi:MAG: DUF1294 domain-containing protein [Lentisphaeraceae bacterium]|nr:DUF1294 domain-containing protein [Lentisphaeraceae bacterium]
MTNKNNPKNSNKYSTTLTLLFIAFLGASVALKKVPEIFLWIYLSLSFITFIIYAKDKRAARKATWRTPEQTLHLLALLGGWPGALVAQQLLRHKTQKKSFRILFWITLILNLSLFIFLISNDNYQLLKKHL